MRHLHSQPSCSPFTPRRPSAISSISHPVRPVSLLHIFNRSSRRTVTATRCPPCLFSPKSSIEYPSMDRQRRLVETHENLHLRCYQRFALIRVQCNTVQLDGCCSIGRGLSRSSNVPRPDPKGLVVQAKPGVCGLAGRASDFCSGPDLSGWTGTGLAGWGCMGMVCVSWPKEGESRGTCVLLRYSAARRDYIFAWKSKLNETPLNSARTAMWQSYSIKDRPFSYVSQE